MRRGFCSHIGSDTGFKSQTATACEQKWRVSPTHAVPLAWLSAYSGTEATTEVRPFHLTSSAKGAPRWDGGPQDAGAAWALPGAPSGSPALRFRCVKCGNHGTPSPS